VSRPRVLFLSRRFLFPLDTGGKIRTAKILEHLKDRWRITLAGTYRPGADDPAEMEALGERYLGVPEAPERAAGPLARWGRRLRRAASPYPLAVLYETSRPLAALVARELATGGYDLLVCDFLQASLNVPWPCPVPSVLFTHNVESRICRRHAELASGPSEKLLWAWQHRLLVRYEGTMTRRFDRVVAVSDSDRREFEEAFGLTSVATIPTGVDTDALRPSGQEPEPDHVVFCGSMDWLPNQDAVRWFVEAVLPHVRTERPDARLTVVGRNPPAAFAAEMSARGPVAFTGWVTDVKPWIERASCVVVPLRIGGGTRIKIYEALALEAPVVSTTVGAEGLPLEPGRHFHCADEPRPFAEKVVECLSDPVGGRALGRQGREYIRQHFGWERVAASFAAIGEEALSGRRFPSTVPDPRLDEHAGH